MGKFEYSAILQVFCGRLADANLIDHPGQVFNRMKEFAWNLTVPEIFSWVYFLGIFDYRGDIIVTQENNRKLLFDDSRIPSLFAISNHTQTYPGLGTLSQFISLVDTLHELGAKVMVDFVPNHTATNHPWVTSHPEYYKRGDHGLVREFSQDVFPLDYGQEPVNEAMLMVLQEIASWKVDGVRCDMAHLIPISFWESVIPKIKESYPSFVFLAEAYSQSVFDWTPLIALQRAGFDSIYDEFFYRNLRDVFNNNLKTSDLANYIQFLAKENKVPLTHYLANHDDPLIKGSIPYQRALLILLACMGGSLLISQGQLLGFTGRLSHHMKEILPSQFASLSNIPSWFVKLRDTVRILEPNIIEIISENNGLVRAKLKTKLGFGELWVNLGQEDQTVGQDVLVSAKSLFYGQKTRIKPGEAEIFI